MQDSLNSNSSNEIDLHELFMILWAYKVFIAGTCALGIFLAGVYSINIKKEYTSTAIFTLGLNNDSSLSIGGELSALASFAGFGRAASGKMVPKNQVKGRIFIEKLDKKLNFRADPFFNRYNPNSVDPSWKAIIKRIIGWQRPFLDPEEATWQNIASIYSSNVILEEDPSDGTIKINVTHSNAKRAAEVANSIMNVVISSSLENKNKEQDTQLDYLSQTLAKALSDLESSQSKLKTFALENSALPLQSFTVGSLQLDALREQLDRTSELYAAVTELVSLLEKKATSQQNYLALRKQFPIVDQVEFRRVLGQNEIISSWSWPDKRSVAGVFDTLSERKKRLESQISASQIDAERFGRALEAHAKLEREAKIAEATYAVLIEQVKAQSMMAGYRPDKSEIYEYAAPPIRPSAIKRSLLMALGFFLGLFFGGGVAIAFAFSRGAYYSRKLLIAASQAHFKANTRALIPLSKCKLKDIKAVITKKPLSLLRDLSVEIHKSGAIQVVVTSSRAKLKGVDVARALASYMQSDTMRIAVINFSEKDRKENVDPENRLVGSFIVVEHEEQVSILQPDSDKGVMELLSQRDFVKRLQALNPSFDLIFLCADNGDAMSLLRALEGQKTFHVTLARVKHTKFDAISGMRSLLPMQGLLHD